MLPPMGTSTPGAVGAEGDHGEVGVAGAEGGAERARRVHLDAVAAAHALEDGPAHEDRFQGSLIRETAVDEVHRAQLRDRVVGIADDHPAGEALGEVAEHEDEGERIGLVARDVDEGSGGKVAALGMLADVLGDHLLEEQLTEQVRRIGVGEPWHLVAPFPAHDKLREALVEGIPVLGRDVMEADMDDAGHALDCTGA